jgi:hypothetical protein
MKVYRDSLKKAANRVGASIKFAGSDMGEWCYPTPYRVADWATAEQIVDELEEQGWTIEQRDAQRITLSMDDHYIEATCEGEDAALTLDTRKGITSAPAH